MSEDRSLRGPQSTPADDGASEDRSLRGPQSTPADDGASEDLGADDGGTSTAEPAAPARGGARAPRHSLVARLYLGEAGVNIVEWRRRWFVITAVVLLIALGGIAIRGFSFGMEFVGGNAFQVPTTVGSLTEVENAVADAGAVVVSGQELGGGAPTYLIRTESVSSEEALAIKSQVADQFGISADDISDDLVSEAWGGHITQQALIALAVFLALVIVYLIIRFEARAAVAAVSGLLVDLTITAGIYAIVGFEVTPATVIGFLTIMGFGLYDTVVIFDKIHENTKDVTADNTRTYGEAANLAVNQVMMRSINTSVVALLPVGGLLFIGAGLLGAGTLKDLGLVLFVGMAETLLSSLFFVTPLLVELKSREPRIHQHTQRVLAKRAAQAQREAQKKTRAVEHDDSADAPSPAALTIDPALVDLAGAAPKVGARPAQSRSARRRHGGAKTGGSGTRSGSRRR
jgi:preprotein translocase subunit SecF